LRLASDTTASIDGKPLPAATGKAAIWHTRCTKAGMRSLNGLSIVCVDDHEDTLDILRYMLELHGAMVYTARTADQALDVLSRFPARIVMVDLVLPNKDGIALIHELRELDAYRSGMMQVVMVSGYCTERDRRLALMAGAVRFIAKPFDESDLLESLGSLIGASVAA
jgi:DNA-binding response OmpR family regulator